MAIVITICAMWILVGLFQLYALAHHGRGLDTAGTVAILSLVFIVLVWPVIVWEHARMICKDRQYPETPTIT